MGRSGAGGGGRSSGSSFSGGSHGRSFGGSSSHRSGASSSSRRSSSSSSFGFTGGSVHRHYHYGPSYGYHRSYPVGHGGGVLSGILSAVVMIFIILVAISILAASQGGGQWSTIQRERLESGNAYVRDCIVDDLGWMDSGRKAQQGMHEFWEKTGVQPWIILTDYYTANDPVSVREEWVREYYDTHCDSDTFLLVYFDSMNSDVMGEFTVWQGNKADLVMDNEAVGIFQGYVLSLWETWDPDDTDGMFGAIFEKTGDTIMKVSTTGKDIMKWSIMAIIVVVVLVGIIIVMNKKRKAERERAEETERILQAGQNQATYGSGDTSMDDLTSRYDNMP